MEEIISDEMRQHQQKIDGDNSAQKNLFLILGMGPNHVGVNAKISQNCDLIQSTNNSGVNDVTIEGLMSTVQKATGIWKHDLWTKLKLFQSLSTTNNVAVRSLRFRDSADVCKDEYYPPFEN